jgi:hypothetical protein
VEADFSISSLDSSVAKNWLDATYLGGPLHVFLDPGSIPVSYVNAAWAASQGLIFNRLETPKRIRYPTGEMVYSFAFVEVSILIKKKIDNKTFSTPNLKLFCLEDLTPQIILGSRHLYELNLYTELPKLELLRQQLCDDNPEAFDVDIPSMAAMDQGKGEMTADIQALLEEFQAKNLFSEDLPYKSAKLDPIKIDLVSELPSQWPPKALQGAPRRQPFEYYNEVVRQTTDLERAGIIVRSTADLWSQILLVKKASGDMRMCVDYKVLNKYTKGLSYPLPDITQIVQQLNGSTLFATLDMTSGYHQLMVDPASQHLTSFRTHTGQFSYRKCPFGLKNAPPWFQFQMSKVLTGLLGVSCLLYIDDIVVYGTDATFATNLRAVLERLAEFDIVLKGSKCRFGVRQITYLGHTLDGEKLFIHDSKAEVFSMLQEPTSLTALRSFVGLMNYYKEHLGSDYSTKMAPLYSKIASYGKQAKVSLALSESEKAAFLEIKALAVQSKTIFFIRPEGELVLKTDASRLAFGGTLTQKQLDDSGVWVERDIAFFSKTFSETQRAWSTSDQEMYAIYFGVRHLHHFLSGRKFLILSDHDALRHDEKPSHSAKVNRWKLHLSEYDFDIKHIKGVDNTVADALSRCLVTESNQDVTMDTSELIVSLASMRSISSSTGSWNLNNTEDRSRLLHLYHGEESGHYDFKTTASRMQANGHVWPGGLLDLKQFILHCPCQKYIPRPQVFHEKPKSLSTVVPNSRWDMDFLVLEQDINMHNCALLVIDSCDRFILELKPLRASTFKEFEPVLRELFCKMGKPISILADGAGNFGSGDYEDLMNFLAIERVPTIPRNSQDNAIVERTIRTVKTQAAAIREERYLTSRSNSWSEILPVVLRNHNARIHSSTGFAPSAVRFGLSDSLSDKSLGYISQSDMLKAIKHNINQAKNKQLQRESKQTESNSLVVGRRFWFRNPDRKKSALEPINLGPYTLLSQDEGKAVIIDIRGTRRTCHISELFPFRGDE